MKRLGGGGEGGSQLGKVQSTWSTYVQVLRRGAAGRSSVFARTSLAMPPSHSLVLPLLLGAAAGTENSAPDMYPWGLTLQTRSQQLLKYATLHLATQAHNKHIYIIVFLIRCRKIRSNIVLEIETQVSFCIYSTCCM